MIKLLYCFETAFKEYEISVYEHGIVIRKIGGDGTEKNMEHELSWSELYATRNVDLDPYGECVCGEQKDGRGCPNGH